MSHLTKSSRIFVFVNENFGSGRKGTTQQKNKCLDGVARAAEVQIGQHRNKSWQNTLILKSGS